jgi:hypothetical protein
MPRRRRAGAAAVELEGERSLALRIFLYSPKDMIAGALALAAVIAIIANALLMQAGRHPAPMFGTVTFLPAAASAPVTASVPASALPRSRPVESEIPLPEERPADLKAADALTNLVKTTSALPPATANIPRPPLTVPVSTRADGTPVASPRRIAAVQRALTQYGYAQLKPTGVVGTDTRAAIEKFEQARKLPVTGQVSDRLVHELALTIGRPVE